MWMYNWTLGKTFECIDEVLKIKFNGFLKSYPMYILDQNKLS